MNVRRSVRFHSLWMLFPLIVALELQAIDAIWPGQVSRAYAQSPVSEDDLFKQMISQAGKAYREGRFPDAIKHFEDALLLRANPNIHWNLSVCYYRLKNLQKSLYHINLYLKQGDPSPKMKRKVEARRVELLRGLKRRLDGGDRQLMTVSPDSMPRSQLYDDRPLEVDQIQTSRGRQRSSATRKRGKALLWGIAALGSFAVGAGVHLYADSIWASRPAGGGSIAQEVRDDALITSWTGDGFLIFGLVAAVVGGVYYWSEPSTTSQIAVSSCASCLPFEVQASRWGVPTLSLLSSKRHVSRDSAQSSGRLSSQIRPQKRHTGALLGWHLSF